MAQSQVFQLEVNSWTDQRTQDDEKCEQRSRDRSNEREWRSSKKYISFQFRSFRIFERHSCGKLRLWRLSFLTRRNLQWKYHTKSFAGCPPSGPTGIQFNANPPFRNQLARNTLWRSKFQLVAHSIRFLRTVEQIVSCIPCIFRWPRFSMQLWSSNGALKQQIKLLGQC